jgi:hypothetical protein
MENVIINTNVYQFFIIFLGQKTALTQEIELIESILQDVEHQVIIVILSVLLVLIMKSICMQRLIQIKTLLFLFCPYYTKIISKEISANSKNSR